MAEIDKAIVEETETPETEEVDIELESDSKEPSPVEVAEAVEDFFKNLAEDMSDDVLQRISNQLLDDFKKDRVSQSRSGGLLKLNL